MNVMINILDQISAAFDTVDHFIKVDVFRRRGGVRDAVLNWLEDYLTNRGQAKHLDTNQFENIVLKPAAYLKALPQDRGVSSSSQFREARAMASGPSS